MYTGQRTIHLWTQDKGPSTFSRGQSSRRVLHPRTTSLNKGLKEGGRRQSISGTLAGKDKRRKELPLSQDDLPHLQEGQGQGRKELPLSRGQSSTRVVSSTGRTSSPSKVPRTSLGRARHSNGFTFGGPALGTEGNPEGSLPTSSRSLEQVHTAQDPRLRTRTLGYSARPTVHSTRRINRGLTSYI